MNKNVKLPFSLDFKIRKGEGEEVLTRDTLDVIELRWIVNLGGLKLKSGKYNNEGFKVKLGSYHSGFYTVEVSLDQYASLYNLLKAVEIKDCKAVEEDENENE